MPIDRGEQRPQRLAVVGFSRNYRSAEVVAALLENDFHIIERPCDDSMVRVVSRISPDVVVLAINPSQLNDRLIVHRLSSAVDSAIVVLGPGQQHTGFRESLEAGADACVSEAFGTAQLVAQVESLVRRARAKEVPSKTEPERITVGQLEVDFRRRAVWFHGAHIAMSPMEFKIIALLAKNAGTVLSPEAIAQEIHEYANTARQARDIKVYVRRLRQKLEAVRPGDSYIFNTRGFGYILDPELVHGRARRAEQPANDAGEQPLERSG